MIASDSNHNKTSWDRSDRPVAPIPRRFVIAVFEFVPISAPFLLPHPSVANYFTVDLAVLKELSQELAELFGLTLPVSLKK
jgi:hypothetical protein